MYLFNQVSVLVTKDQYSLQLLYFVIITHSSTPPSLPSRSAFSCTIILHLFCCHQAVNTNLYAGEGVQMPDSLADLQSTFTKKTPTDSHPGTFFGACKNINDTTVPNCRGVQAGDAFRKPAPNTTKSLVLL